MKRSTPRQRPRRYGAMSRVAWVRCTTRAAACVPPIWRHSERRRSSMTREETLHVSRRAFLSATGGALVGLSALGLVGPATAATRDPHRGGTLNYGASGDVGGLDAHRHNQLHFADPTSVMYTGLTDLDQQGNI